MRNNRHAMTEEARWVTPAQGPQLVRWGSVFSGTIISIAVFSLLTALWLALSFRFPRLGGLQQPALVDRGHGYFLHVPGRHHRRGQLWSSTVAAPAVWAA